MLQKYENHFARLSRNILCRFQFSWNTFFKRSFFPWESIARLVLCAFAHRFTHIECKIDWITYDNNNAPPHRHRRRHSLLYPKMRYTHMRVLRLNSQSPWYRILYSGRAMWRATLQHHQSNGRAPKSQHAIKRLTYSSGCGNDINSKCRLQENLLFFFCCYIIIP